MQASLILFFLVSSCASVLYAPSAEQFVQVIEQQCLVATPEQEQEWPHESYYSFLMRCMDYQRNLPQAKCKRAAFKIICPHLQQLHTMSHVLDDHKTWTDLCLFHGQQDIDQSLIAIINRCYTQLGSAMLSCMLVSPSENSDELERRQRIIQTLINDEQLLARLSDQLATFARVENFVLSFWLQDLLYHSADGHFFNMPRFAHLNETFNSNCMALDIKTTVARATATVGFLSNVAACIVLPMYALLRLKLIYAQKNLSGLVQTARRLIGTTGSAPAFITQYLKSRNIDAGIALLGSSYCLLSMKESFESMRDNMVLDRCVQEKMIAVADAWRATKQLADSIKANQTMCDALLGSDALYEFIYHTPQQSKDIKNLVTLFKTPTLKNTASIFCRVGRALSAFSLMHQCKDMWGGALTAIAELDAYVSLARLYKECARTDHPYCFAQFVQGPQPHVSLTDFWNPFIKQHVSVNSVEIGGPSEHLNILITGPNAGGKSTILRAIALNVIMAQSFGIAPARTLVMTPFSSIVTYLNITDDITVGKSLFKAEVLRAQSLLDRVARLKPHQFNFTVIDEMFSGASALEGQAASYSVAHHLCTYNNSMCILATHFPLLTQLAEHTHCFANYKVSVHLHNDGTIEYPFKLEPGISHQYIALDILQAEGFASSILAQARDVVRATTDKW